VWRVGRDALAAVLLVARSDQVAAGTSITARQTTAEKGEVHAKSLTSSLPTRINRIQATTLSFPGSTTPLIPGE
jgi:hypothetical protein